MCLDKLDEKQRVRGGVGYKILEQVDNNYYTGAIQGGGQKLSEKRFIPDKSLKPISMAGTSQTYPAGFHIFLTTAELGRFRSQMGWNTYPVRRVRFKDVGASGTQDCYGTDVRVIVARKIKLLPDKEESHG